ncbi:MAG: DUF401 family protein [bacterium]|nr:DUF401 family protein [bacterium]
MTNILWEIPILIKVSAVFALVLWLIRKKFQIGTAMFAGAIVLGLWCRMSIGELAYSIATTMLDLKTVLLSLVVAFILILSRSLECFEQMKRLLASFKGLIGNDRFNLVLFPALIGLLPMPGGAIFSAPMVEELGHEHQFDPETKTLLNYWFRHIWEFAWPLYPGILLASSLASVSLWTFIGHSFPIMFLSAFTGYFFFLRSISAEARHTAPSDRRGQLKAFAKEIIPVLIVVFGALGGNVGIVCLQRFFPNSGEIPAELPLLAALALSIAYVWFINKASAEHIRGILLNRSLLKMVYMIVAIFIFKEVLVDSHAVTDLSAFLARQFIPLWLLVILIPFIVGSISGITVAFVGTSFPVLLSLFQAVQLDDALLLPYLILGYCSGFSGVLFSPLHVCLIFSKEYFQADFRKIYHRLWQPVLMLLTGSILYAALLIALKR